MPTKNFDVRVKFKAGSAKQLQQSISKSAKGAQKLNREVKGVNRSLRTSGTLATRFGHGFLGLLGVGGAIYGLRRLGGALVGAHTDMVRTKMALSTVLMGSGFVDSAKDATFFAGMLRDRLR